MIVDSNYPQDIRVRKEAESLIKFGFAVKVLCIAKKNISKHEIINGVEVERLLGYSFILKGLSDIFNAIFHVNPFFYLKAKSIVKSFDGVVVVHDLPLVLTISKLKNRKAKLILDMHENYPEALKTWFLWRKSTFIKLKNKLFFSYKRWFKIEQKALKHIDGLIVVVDEMKKNVLEKHPKFNKPIEIIPNYEVKDFFNELPRKPGGSKFVPKDKFTITYMGGIGPHRGLDTPIKAMPFILKKNPEAQLLIFGSGHSDNINFLKGLAQKHKVSDNVKFFGYIPFSEFNKVMLQSKVNIIPHNSDDHTDNTVPHKLFQMLMVGVPILVSSCKPLKRIVKKTNSGYVFEASNEVSFAEKIIEIYENYDKAKQLAKNGFQSAHDGEFNWDALEPKLTSFFKQF